MNGYPTIHLIHGFNERHTFKEGPSIKRLAPYLQGDYRVHTWDYGFSDLLDVRKNNDNYGRLIGSTIEPDDILIGFSNGCALIEWMLEQLHVEIKEIHFLHPAVEKDWQAPDPVEKVFIFFNSKDFAVRAGKWWRRASRVLPWNWRSKNRNHWGEMGMTGYTGPKDPRVRQFDTGNTAGMPPALGHGGLFEEPVIPEWGQLIMDLIKQTRH